jgi:hypothetical protein
VRVFSVIFVVFPQSSGRRAIREHTGTASALGAEPQRNYRHIVRSIASSITNSLCNIFLFVFTPRRLVFQQANLARYHRECLPFSHIDSAQIYARHSIKICCGKKTRMRRGVPQNLRLKTRSPRRRSRCIACHTGRTLTEAAGCGQTADDDIHSAIFCETI